jgi:PAS domain S-box-containing protein
MKSKQATSRARWKLSANGKVGKTKRSVSAPVFSHPKTELEAAIQPYVGLTERERFEERIQRSEERYRTLFDLVPVAVYTCDANGVIRDYNRRAVELWGREPGQNGEKPRFCGSYKIYYPDGRYMPHKECPVARLLRGEKLKAEDLEIVVERPDGERRHVIPAPRIFTNTHGKITGAINSLFDITERKTAEAAAMRLAAVVQSSHDAVAAKTLNGIITDWNQSAERIFGYKPKEIIGKSILTLIPKDRQDEEQEILRRIRHGESLEHYETVRRRKNGQLIDVSLTISPIKSAKGEIVGVSKIARDITNQKQTERRLAEQGAAPRFEQRRNHRPRLSRPDRLLEPRRGGNVRLLRQRSARKNYARAATDGASGKFRKDSKKIGARSSLVRVNWFIPERTA